mmetsp:Transcript_15182/g.45779  ORF Transcript_15182/g.45779 Transcript_15182/m.45779 type:complete len:373 (+) Transcript_15182:227-1345(+)
MAAPTQLNKLHGASAQHAVKSEPWNSCDCEMCDGSCGQLDQASPTDRLKLSRVLVRSMAMVIGPTPPGTGVMRDAFSLASSKCTSPTSRYPSFFEGSSTALMPTSMTTAPGFIQSPRIISARPHAAITTSASRQISAPLGVLECTTVTVASWPCSRRAAGVPTMLDRPTTTARLPDSSTPALFKSSMHPLGVHATKAGSRPRMARRPMLSGPKPSTSLSPEMASSTRCSLMWAGMGSCTRMPCTAGSSLYPRTTCSTSSSVASSGRSVPKSTMPTSTHAFFLLRTYDWLSLRPPTSTTASPGALPCFSFKVATSAVVSLRMVAAVALPSISSAVMTVEDLRWVLRKIGLLARGPDGKLVARPAQRRSGPDVS